jgi:hypothetical protein
MDTTPTQPVDNASSAPTESVMVPPAASTTTERSRGFVHDSEAAGAAPDPNAVAEVAAAPEANPPGGVDDTDSSEASGPPALSELKAARRSLADGYAEILQMKKERNAENDRRNAEIKEKEKSLAATKKVVEALQYAAEKESNDLLREETIARIVGEAIDHQNAVYSCAEDRFDQIDSNGKRMRKGIEANSDILKCIHNNVGQILSMMQARNDNNGSHPVAATSAVQENAVEGETVLSKPDHGASGPAKSFEGHIITAAKGSVELRQQGEGYRLPVQDLVGITIDSRSNVEFEICGDGRFLFEFSHANEPDDSLVFRCSELVADDLMRVLEAIGVDIKLRLSTSSSSLAPN